MQVEELEGCWRKLGQEVFQAISRLKTMKMAMMIRVVGFVMTIGIRWITSSVSTRRLASTGFFLNVANLSRLRVQVDSFQIALKIGIQKSKCFFE